MISTAPMAVTAVVLQEVGPEWDAVFAAGPGFQSSRAWFEATIEAALAPGQQAMFLLCRKRSRPVAMLPLLQGPGRRTRGLSTVYTCLFQPLLASGLEHPDIRRAGAALGIYCRRWPLVLLDALDPSWTDLPPLLAGIRDAGLVVRQFDHFGNWHQPVAECSWQSYLAARSGQLRETIRRKTNACLRNGQVRIDVVRCTDELGPAAAAYEEVYRRSWKAPEPAPGFTAALLPRAARAGVLRMGVMWVGAQPVAAQYWTVAGGTATVLKLAHDAAWRSLSPGTVLTAHMIHGLLDEGVAELDFGRGDDEYKASWTGLRRPRIGLLLANPRHPKGAWALARHAMGIVLRKTRARLNGVRSWKFFRRFDGISNQKRVILVPHPIDGCAVNTHYSADLNLTLQQPNHAKP